MLSHSWLAGQNVAKHLLPLWDGAEVTRIRRDKVKETLIGPLTTNCLLVRSYMVILLALKSHPVVVWFIAFPFISWLLLNLHWFWPQVGNNLVLLCINFFFFSSFFDCCVCSLQPECMLLRQVYNLIQVLHMVTLGSKLQLGIMEND